VLHCTFSDCLDLVGAGLACSENVGLGWVVKKVSWVGLGPTNWTHVYHLSREIQSLPATTRFKPVVSLPVRMLCA